MTEQNDLFNIEILPEENKLIIELKGQMNAETHQQFQSVISDAVKKISISGNKINILFDLMQAKTQTQDVANRDEWIIQLIPYINKCAIAVESILYKLQLERKPLGENFKFFTNLQEAKQWLDEG